MIFLLFKILKWTGLKFDNKAYRSMYFLKIYLDRKELES